MISSCALLAKFIEIKLTSALALSDLCCATIILFESFRMICFELDGRSETALSILFPYASKQIKIVYYSHVFHTTCWIELVLNLYRTLLASPSHSPALRVAFGCCCVRSLAVNTDYSSSGVWMWYDRTIIVHHTHGWFSSGRGSVSIATFSGFAVFCGGAKQVPNTLGSR